MCLWTRLRARRGLSGFSLIEVMAALAIMSVALVMVIQLFSSSLRTTRQAADVSHAVLVARSVLEESCALPNPLDAAGIYDMGENVSAEVVVLERPVDSDPKLYEITVSVEGTGGEFALSCVRAYHEHD